jgi:hypothetical protein
MKCEETGLVVFNSTLEMVKDPNVFLIDTGASVHSTGNSFGLYDLKDPKGSSSTVGNGSTVKTKSIGKMRVTVCNKGGNELSPLTVNEMHLMPGSPFNLLSGTNMIMQGCRMIGEGSSITFTKGGWQLVCDLKIKTSSGLLYGVYLKRKPTQQQRNQETTATVITKSVKQAHQQLGHKPEDLTRQMAKHLGWMVTRGTLKPCESCARAKAKQKDIKTTKEEPSKKATDVNGRVYLDISSIKEKDLETLTLEQIPSQNHWRMVVDELTGKKFSGFYKAKNEMIEPTCELFNQWKDQGKPVIILRMDNAGENIKLVKRLCSADWKMNPKIEFTPRDTPQYNHLVEIGFPTIQKQATALMNEANIPKAKRYKVWYKAYGTATKLDGLVPVEINGKTQTRDEHFYGKNPAFAKHLRTWGEAGVVKLKEKTQPKLDNHGKTCMFVGYPDNHPGDTYEMLDWETKGVHTT